MRKIIMLLCILLSFQYFAEAQDSVKLKNLTNKVDTIEKNVNTIKNRLDTSISKNKNVDEKCKCYDHPLNKNGDWFLILLPVIVFVALFILALIFGLYKFNIADALTESEYTRSTVLNPLYNSENIKALAATNKPNLDAILPPTLEVSQVPQAAVNAQNQNPPANENPSTLSAIPPKASPSMSRYIAFITSIMTLIIALCMGCFFIYHYIRTGCAPDLSPLSMILIALGLGVAPYAFNKVSSAIAARKED
ncbi:MAG TPA: hypothetical protein VGQ09_17040 [Chitinophagaceae bacterium]|jgi:hypothetical protein|nr:hypothetical protein [Chitinophagaceae bacterium]